MKTFSIRNGDLVIGPGGFETISGPAKVKQDLAVAMREPYGCDRFHPKWGSLLGDFVGTPASKEVESLVTGEINRLVQNYSMLQAEAINVATANNRRVRHSSGEVVTGVDGIRIVQQFDRYYVRVIVRTMSGEQVSLTRAVEA